MNDKEKYQFRPYDHKFKKLFSFEKKKVSKILSFASAVEHFGSTSVPGLGGKGIIDIIISVPKSRMLVAKKLLEENNYEFSEAGGNKERFFFEKNYKYGDKIRRVHVHLTFNDSLSYRHAIIVRDCLRTNLQVNRDYVKLKKEAAKLCKGDGKFYRNYKNGFLDKLAHDLDRKNIN